MKYNVRVERLNNLIVSEIEHEVCNMREVIVRSVLDTADAQVIAALKALGWTPPAHSANGRRKCIVAGCNNRADEGHFEGGLCGPCYEMLTTGRVANGTTFIHSMKDRLHKISNLSS